MSRLSDTAVDATDTFDVYVDRKYRVWLVDFGAYGGDTSPLLFTWEELGCECGAASGSKVLVPYSDTMTTAQVENATSSSIATANDVAGPEAQAHCMKCSWCGHGRGDSHSRALDTRTSQPHPVVRVLQMERISFAPLAHHGFPDDLMNGTISQ